MAFLRRSVHVLSLPDVEEIARCTLASIHVSKTLKWRKRVAALKTILSQVPSTSLSLPDVMRQTIASQRSRKSRKPAGAGEEEVPKSKTPADTPADLKLKARVCYLPKKNPKIPLGQDDHFIDPKTHTIGIADGVGGFKQVDSGRYARQLMGNAHDYVKGQPRNGVDPMKVLEAAFQRSNRRGGSTACIITLKGNSLHAVNLGDPGFRVIRGGKTVYKSPVQQVKFNQPFQLMSKVPTDTAAVSQVPADADEIVVDVEPGDLLVVGTDGLFDNLFDAEIEEVLNSIEDIRPSLVAIAAFELGHAARRKSVLKNYITPFSLTAAKNGRNLVTGGKYDDVTVIVGSFIK